GFSRTHTQFEMWTPLGVTAVPVKQKDDQQQQGQQGQQAGGGQDGGGGDAFKWNKKQPQGEAAEFIVNYVNGSRAHPIGMTNDRRGRACGLKEGESGFYSAGGSGQMLYHRVRGDDKDGVYLLTTNDEDGQSLAAEMNWNRGLDRAAQQQQKRFISIRHVKKKKQRRKKQQSQQATPQAGDGGGGGGQDTGRLPDDSKSGYKHEGDEVHVEQRLTEGQIQYYDSTTKVGHYDKGNKDWLHHDGQGAKHSMRADQKHSHIKHDGNHIWVDEGNCKSS